MHGSGGYTTPASVGVPVTCGGVTVREGDLILGDVNGVVAIPRDRAEEILVKVEELARIEEQMTADLEGGATIAETFKKHRG